MLGIMLLCFMCTGAANPESSRVVVTFKSASLNTLEAAELVPDDITVVKQYGRRLVLHLGGGNNSLTDSLWLAGIWEEAVERIEPDWLVDTSGGTPWHLNSSEPYGLHLDSALRNASTVALLDSGMAKAGSELWNPVTGYCFISSSDYTNTNLGRNPDFTDPGDQGPNCLTPSWHGTKVASVVKAVAPNSKLSVLRVLGRCGTGFASDVTDAIVWAAGGGINGVRANPFPAKVVSMSLAGRGGCPTYMQSAVNQAIALGATVVAAAGNAGANATLYFPGNCKGVLSIGASTREGKLAAYSNWGGTLALSAPGGDAANPVSVLTVGSDGVLIPSTAMGTSFAAPHVAGVVALLLGANLSLATGGRYVPCVGGCGERGILNGMGGFDNMNLAHIRPSQTTGNSSLVFGVGESCVHGYDTTKGADRYGGSYYYDLYCGPGEYVGVYEIGHHLEYIFFASFSCYDQYGSFASRKRMGNTGVSSYSTLSATSLDVGFYYYFFESLSKVGISDKAQSWQMGYGLSNALQECKGDERIVGFHGWYGNGLDESKIYCRKTCNCAPGEYNNYGICSPCVSGYSFSSGPGSYSCTACSTCNDGYYRNNACTIYSDSTCQQCTLTSPGFYRNGGCLGNHDSTFGSCAGCAAGYYREGCGGTSAGSCDPCPAYNYCPGSIYTLPKPWTVTSCSAGFYLSPTPSSTTDGYCQPCASGDFCAGGTATSKSDCPVGSYCSSDAKTKTPCPAGGFCPARSTSPSTCDKGSYSAATGAVSAAVCQLCGPGTYSSSSQPTACLLCPQGKKSSTSGLSTCTDCEAINKNYQDLTGQTTCKTCNKTACSAGQTEIICENTHDRYCTSCSLTANCLFSPGTTGCKTNSGEPSCNCIPGFQMTLVNLVYSCTQCPPGTYKPLVNGNTCASWTKPEALGCSSSQYAAAGTRTSDRECVDFPLPPDNAYTNELGWGCNIGYEKS